MSEFEGADDYMRRDGMTDGEIADLKSVVDQANTWLREAVPYAIAARMAAMEGDWEKADHMGKHIGALLLRIKVTDHVAVATVELLLTKIAAFSMERGLLGGGA